MGILFFGDSISPPSVLWMRRMLEGMGQDVAVFVTESDPGPEYRELYRTVVVSDGPSLPIWRVLRRLSVVASIPKTRRAVRPFLAALESDHVSAALVHYVTSAVDYRNVWARTRKPIYVHCHGWDVTWNLRSGSAPGRPVHARDYVSRVRALPDHVQFIANSRFTKQRLCDIGIDNSRIHLKYLGVPVSPSPPERRYEGEDVTILYLGNLVDCKGPEVVIRAFDAACARGLRGRLVLAGEGRMRDECERARAESSVGDRIEMTGAVDAVTATRLRESADIFTAHNRVGPVSRQAEAFGVSIVEAMAAGIPVVSANSGGVPEVVEDGVQGFLVEQGNVAAHADMLLKLARDPDLRARMGHAGWQRARDNFSLDREISALCAILRVSK